MYDNFLSCYDINQLLIDLNNSLVAFRQRYIMPDCFTDVDLNAEIFIYEIRPTL
jgi:hypothetical protein